MQRLRQMFPAPLLPLVVGLVVAVIGLILLIGGIWLVALGGSPYYLINGTAMLASGLLLMRGALLGGWLYCAIFLCTLIWALWEVGTNGWALVPRLIAPLVLLVGVLLAMAPLSTRHDRWRIALGSAAALILLFAVSGVLLSLLNSPRPLRDLPGEQAAMAEP